MFTGDIFVLALAWKTTNVFLIVSCSCFPEINVCNQTPMVRENSKLVAESEKVRTKRRSVNSFDLTPVFTIIIFTFICYSFSYARTLGCLQILDRTIYILPFTICYTI